MNNHPFRMAPTQKHAAVLRWYYLSALVTIGIISTLLLFSIRDYAQIKTLKNKYREKEHAASQVDTIRESITAYQTKIAQLEAAQQKDHQNTSDFEQFFRTLSHLIPDDVAVETVHFGKESNLWLTGVAYRFEAIDEFTKKMHSKNPTISLSLDSLESTNSNKSDEPPIRFRLVAHS